VTHEQFRCVSERASEAAEQLGVTTKVLRLYGAWSPRGARQPDTGSIVLVRCFELRVLSRYARSASALPKWREC
jgi:hypothetical protein